MADIAPPTLALAKWTCRLSKLDAKGNPSGDLGDQAITVGEKFLISCEGASVDLNSAKLSLEVPEKAKYALRILEVRSFSAGRGDFVATTWTGAPVEFEQLILSDGNTRVDLGSVKFNVQSVIPEEKKQKPEPVPPYGPIFLGLPSYVWISLALVLLAIGLWISWLIARVVKQKKLKRLLAQNQVALSPFNHFNKELRRLVRGGTADSAAYVRDLREAFRWYLARDLVIPAIDGSPKQILKAVARKYPERYQMLRRDLTLALTELEKAAVESAPLAEADLTQLTELCRSIADRLELQRKKGA